MKLNSSTMSVSGNWTYSSGTLTAGSSTVTFNAGSGTQSFNSGAQSFASVKHSGAGTLQLSTNKLTVTKSFTNSAGIFDANAGTVTVVARPSRLIF